MSIFSSIRRAKEHNAKVAEQKKKQQAEAPRQPYRHIPTHAASDAFASAPPSWREAADRPKIMEQNRRRTAMEANTMPMMPVNFHGIPRVRSTSSFVTYSGALTANDSRPYRTYSYTTSSPHLDRGRDAVYTNPDMSMSQPSMPQRLGDRAGRVVSTHKPPPMPFPFGTGDTGSFSELSSDSGSSQDEFEMRPLERRASSQTISKQRPHRLHPSSRSRNPSLSSGSSDYLPLRRSQDSLAPPSIKGFTIIHATTQSAGAMDSPTVSDDASCVVVPETKPRREERSFEGSALSLPSVSPRASKEQLSSRSTSPVPQDLQAFEFPRRSSSLHGSKVATASYGTDETELLMAPPPRSFERRPSRPPRFHLERIQSMAEEPYIDYSHIKTKDADLPVARVEVINYLPNPLSGDTEPNMSPPKSKGKLKKGGSRLQKKSKR